MEKEKSPPRPPSILKKRPMAAMRSDKVQKPEKPHLEYRIIVSNLRNTVTGGDIEVGYFCLLLYKRIGSFSFLINFLKTYLYNFLHFRNCLEMLVAW